jgi:hypothetical protein
VWVAVSVVREMVAAAGMVSGKSSRGQIWDGDSKPSNHRRRRRRYVRMTLLHCLANSSDLVPSKALEIRAGVTESVPADGLASNHLDSAYQSPPLLLQRQLLSSALGLPLQVQGTMVRHQISYHLSICNHTT